MLGNRSNAALSAMDSDTRSSSAVCILDKSYCPPAITCKQCSYSCKYTDGNQKLFVEVKLCFAHKKGIAKKPSTSRDADKKKHAEFVLEIVKELTADGTLLESALETIRISYFNQCRNCVTSVYNMFSYDMYSYEIFLYDVFMI